MGPDDGSGRDYRRHERNYEEEKPKKNEGGKGLTGINKKQYDALSPDDKKAIDKANETDGIIFCEISLWEISMLISRLRLKVDTSYQEFIKLVFASNNYQYQGITPEIAEKSTTLPDEVNNDPVDRIISATSIIKKASLVTADKNLLKAKCVKTIW